MNERLDAESLRGLIDSSVGLVRVRGFYDADAALRLARAIGQLAVGGYNAYSQGIGCLGIPLHTAIGRPELLAEYQMRACREQTLRTLVAGGCSRWMRLSTRWWEVGRRASTGETLGERPLFAGLSGFFPDGAGALPHTDWLPRDIGESEPHGAD